MKSESQGERDDELVQLVDVEGRPTGVAPRTECHRNRSMLHAAVHVLVFNRAGEIFLQRRSPDKEIQPGLWDSSVGGHVRPDERPEEAAIREMREELGVTADLHFSHEYIWWSQQETEYVRTYLALHEGPFVHDPWEIAEAKFWTREEISRDMGTGVFTPNFELEVEWLRCDLSGVLRRWAKFYGWKGERPFI